MHKIQIIPLGFLRMNSINWSSPCLFCLIFAIPFLLTSLAFASGAELTNLVVKNTKDDLLIDIKIKGVFTNEMREALLNGMPISFTFLVILYEVHDFWFDTKLAHKTTNHKIQYDALKKEYRIIREWENAGPMVVKNFENARLIISEINSLKVIPLTWIKKGNHYQLRVKSELNGKKFPFSGFPWEFETDWYTINFIY